MRKALFATALLGLAPLSGCKKEPVEGLPHKDEAPLKKDSDAKKDTEAKKDTDPKKDGEPKKDGDKKDKDKKVERPKHVPPKAIEPTGEVTKLASVAYGEAFKDDSATTTRKYKGKFVELTGRVTKLLRMENGAPVLVLEGDKGEFSLGVYCYCRDPKFWLTPVLPGQTAQVRGVGTEDEGTATLDKCDVLKVEGEPPPTFTPDELSAAYGKGGLDKKYGGKSLVIEGEIALVEAKSKSDPDDVRKLVVFKRADRRGPGVFLLFNPIGADNKRAASLKPGQKVRAVGTFATDQMEALDDDKKSVKVPSVGTADTFLLDVTP